MKNVFLISLHFAEYSWHLARELSVDTNVVLFLYRDNADNELGGSYSNIERESHLRVVILERPKNLGGVFKNMKLLLDFHRKIRPDFVHVQEAMRDEIALSIPLMFGSKKILTVHDPEKHMGEEQRRFRFSRHRVYRKILRFQADVAISHGQFLVEQLEKIEPRLRGRTVSIPHGPLWGGCARIDLRFCQSRRSIYPKRILFFGRIQKYKGLKYFVEAVKELNRRSHSVVGVIAGRGPELELVRDKLESLEYFDVRDRFIPVSEVEELFKTSHLTVLPYIEGTQSGVAAMALGYACPVVCTSVGSLPELVIDGKNGTLVPPADLDALVAAIERLIVDADYYSQCCEGSKELVDGDLSWARIAERTLRAYDGFEVR